MRPSEGDLRAIFENMLDAYYRTDKEGRCLLISPSATDLLGYTPGEIVGHPVAEFFVDPVCRQRALDDLIQNGGNIKDYEIALRHKDGRTLWFSLNAQVYYDGAGEIAGSEGYCRDITEKKRAAERLRQSEQKLRAIFNHLLDVYYRTDCEGKLINVSPSVKTLLGYNPEEILGNAVIDFYADPSSRERFFEALKVNNGVVYGFESKLLRKDGTEVWILASSQLCFDENGDPDGVEGMVKDISARKVAEENLQQYSERLQETLHNLETICYSVAHDLRGPLRAISGYAHILLEDCGPSLGQKGERTIALLNKKVVWMGDLIEALLSYARAGRARKNISVFEMATLVHEVVAAFDRTTIEFRVGTLPSVQADRSLLRSVFSNLIDNAVKFSRKSEHPMIEIDTFQENRQVVFFVRDNGIGFEQRYAKRLFQLFEQLHSLPDYQGTGVGLAIVERVITKHGGRVWAEGEEGKGATFFFALPSTRIVKEQPIANTACGPGARGDG